MGSRKFRIATVCWSRNAKGGVVTINKSFRVFNLELNLDETEYGPQNYAIGQILPATPPIASRGKRITFSSELRGSETADLLFPEGPLLRACGFAEASSGTSPNIIYNYTRGSSKLVADGGDTDPITLVVYLDGLKHTLSGCVGTVRFDFEAGKLPMMHFDMVGNLDTSISVGESGETEVAPTETFTAGSAAVPCGDYSATVDAVSGLVIERISYDPGWSGIISRNLNGDVFGRGQAETGVPDPKMTIRMKAPALATYDARALQQAQTVQAVAFVHNTAGAARQKWTGSFKGVICEDPVYEDGEGGIGMLTIVLSEVPDSGGPFKLANS